MAMNELLANYYGTNGAGQREELEKQAQIELFSKLAAENNIDLNALTDEQVQGLWDTTFKTASDEEGKKEESDEEKKEKAQAEFAEKKEASDKLAEADFLGRTMAHSYVDELRKIAGEATPGETVEQKEAGLKDKAQKALWAVQGKANKAGKAVGGHLERVGKKVTNTATGAGGGANAMAPGKAKAVGAGVYGAGGAAAAGAGVAAKKHMDKKSSAIDELAFGEAVEKAASAGFDAEEAAQRVNAVLILGVEESTKIAAAQDVDEAVGIRSLELLELAGYPIEWA